MRAAICLAMAVLLGAGCERRPEPPERKPAPKPGSSLAVAEQRGAALYAQMCAVCHGRHGEGYAADRAPRLAHPNFLAAASDDFLAHAVAEGRSGTTMSAWAKRRGGPLSKSDVAAIVAFLRSFETLPQVKLDDRAAAGSVTRGAAIYDAQCRSCHGARGVGGPELHIGGAEFLHSASDGFLRHAIQRGRPGTPMLAYQGKLSAQEIEDVVTLIRSWQASAPVHRAAPAAPLPLGPIPQYPNGPEPAGFNAYPKHTKVDVVKAALDRKARLVVLDARAPSDYLKQHIAGAVSVPFYAPEPYVADLPKDVWLVCYCACPHAESRSLASKLVAHGFQRVTVLDEGLGVWKRRGYPMSAASPTSESATP